MSTITTINASDQITNSRSVINTNFANLNTDKIETSVIDTDTTLSANSDAKIPSQKAVKAYADSVIGANASETSRGIVEEATDAEVTAGTATGSTGAKLFITPTKLLTYLTALFLGLAPRASVFSTIFETSARFTAVTSGGTNTFGTDGLVLDTTSTGNRYAGIRATIMGSTDNIFSGSPVFTCNFTYSATQGFMDSFFGLGTVTVAGSGHTYTTDHIGFKLTANNTDPKLFATQGDGTTENASAEIVSITSGDSLQLMIKVNGSSSVDYYYRKNGGAWSSATNLTSNMPDTASRLFQCTVSNTNTAQQTTITLGGASYSR